MESSTPGDIQYEDGNSRQPREIREEPIHEELLQYSPKPVHGYYHKVFLAHLLGHRWVAHT